MSKSVPVPCVFSLYAQQPLVDPHHSISSGNRKVQHVDEGR